jgi:hypothetical protein
LEVDLAVISVEVFLMVVRRAPVDGGETGTTCLYEIDRFISDKKAEENIDGLEEDEEETR